MDIEKTVKFFIFAFLALLPVVAGLIFFDYSELKNIQLFQDFGRNTSIIGVVIIYTIIGIIIRMTMYYMLGFIKDKGILDAIETSSFMDIFYISCVELFLYSSIPIIITFASKGNFIHFIGNTLIVWVIIFVFWIIWILLIRNKQITE